MHIKGSPFGRAPAIAGERAGNTPLRRLRRHLSQGRGFFVIPIITQIGREDKFSADIFVPVNSPLMTTEKSSQRFLFLLIKQHEHASE